MNYFIYTYIIFLESSKTDQFRDGAWVAVARSNQDTCPVKALEQYIAAAKIDLGEDLPLFRALSSSRSTSKVRRQGLRGLSNTPTNSLSIGIVLCPHNNRLTIQYN